MKLNMKKAFTLVEMLIVIVIIGILAAALIPRLTGIQSRARDVARTADLQQLSTALATWNLDNGIYIASGTAGSISTWLNTGPLAESVTLTGRSVAAFAVEAVLWNLVFKGLLKDIPKETNAVTFPYTYQFYNSGTVFSINALSEGGWVKANYFSGSTWSIWSIADRILVPSNITSRLCTSVDQWPNGYATGWACTTDVNRRNARYVIAN